jgi:ADP-ribose pyrophosphatase YjhB (NUDIX family)
VPSEPHRRSRPRIDAKHTADLVVLAIHDDHLKILLVVRDNKPFRGMLALPGGFLRHNEELEDTAHRELFEETGISASQFSLIQLKTYSALGRDPRGRVLTTAFLAIAPRFLPARGGTDARSADWVEVDPSLESQLAFDHWDIVNDALEKIRGEIEFTPLATAFCGDLFTIPELRRTYELIWDVELEPGNFRRKVVHGVSGLVKATGKRKVNQNGGRPADLYRRGTAKIIHPPILRPNKV